MSYIPHSANPTVAHYLSWFGDFDEKSFNNNDGISVYTKANINVNNFSLEKNKVLYLLDEIHDSEIPDDCALIKFSYNSEHKETVLIEEENVAIVSDGREGEAIIDIITSLKSYQFLCDENGIPFTDTCDVALVVKQGNVKLKILSISVSSEDTDFKDGLYSCKIKNEQGVVINGTEHNSINSQMATISLSVLRGEKQAKDRIVAKFTVTYEKDNEFIEEKKDIETLEYLFTISSVATGVYLGMMVSVDTSNGYFTFLDEKGKMWVTGSEGKNINRGDYMLWGGDSVNIENGEFVKGLVYVWNGIGWERDTNESHTIATFSDVINIAESLDDSSETVKVYKSLTTALLNVGRIFANNITLTEQFDKKGNSKKGIIKSANWESKVGGGDGRGTLNGDQTIANYSNTGWALDYNGKADFTNMNANGGKFTNITADGGKFTNITADGGTFKNGSFDNMNANGGSFTNITADGGTFKNGSFDNITANGLFLTKGLTGHYWDTNNENPLIPLLEESLSQGASYIATGIASYNWNNSNGNVGSGEVTVIGIDYNGDTPKFLFTAPPSPSWSGSGSNPVLSYSIKCIFW